LYREGNIVYRVLVGNPGRKALLRGPRRDLENNNKMNLQEENCGIMYWIDMAHFKDMWWELVNAVMNLLVP